LHGPAPGPVPDVTVSHEESLNGRQSKPVITGCTGKLPLQDKSGSVTPGGENATGAVMLEVALTVSPVSATEEL